MTRWPELRAQQRLGERQAALRESAVRAGHERGLASHSEGQHSGRTRSPRCGGASSAAWMTAVDDQRPDVGDACRQDAGDQRKGGKRDRQRPIGGPDQGQGAPAVFEQRSDAASKGARRAVRRVVGGQSGGGLLQGAVYRGAGRATVVGRDARPPFGGTARPLKAAQRCAAIVQFARRSSPLAVSSLNSGGCLAAPQPLHRAAPFNHESIWPIWRSAPTIPGMAEVIVKFKQPPARSLEKTPAAPADGNRIRHAAAAR